MGYKISYLTLFAMDDKLSPILKRIGLNGSNRVNSKEEYTNIILMSEFVNEEWQGLRKVKGQIIKLYCQALS